MFRPTPKNVAFFRSKTVVGKLRKFHIMKDKRLVSKMEGRTNFSETPETV